MCGWPRDLKAKVYLAQDKSTNHCILFNPRVLDCPLTLGNEFQQFKVFRSPAWCQCIFLCLCLSEITRSHQRNNQEGRNHSSVYSQRGKYVWHAFFIGRKSLHIHRWPHNRGWHCGGFPMFVRSLCIRERNFTCIWRQFDHLSGLPGGHIGDKVEISLCDTRVDLWSMLNERQKLYLRSGRGSCLCSQFQWAFHFLQMSDSSPGYAG